MWMGHGSSLVTVGSRDGRRPMWLSRDGTGHGCPGPFVAHWSEEKSFDSGCVLKVRPTGCARKRKKPRMTPEFLANGKPDWPFVGIHCGNELGNGPKQDLQSLQVESFLERAVNHLRPQYALVYKKKKKKGNLQIMCFLDEGMKSNIMFY